MADQQHGNGGDNPSIIFDYIKSPVFRTIRADGAIGGPTPTGHIHFALYNERQAIPRQVVHTLNADGTLGPEISERRVSRPGIVRDMDVDVFMSVDVAENFCNWLREQIQTIRARTQSAPGPKKGSQ